jgi:predicted permease
MKVMATFADVLQDLRFGLRQLAKAPVFATVAILTLALGIGANTAIFSVTNAILLRLLPVRSPERLVYLHTSDFPGNQDGYGDTSLTEPVFESLRNRKEVFSDLMAYAPLGFNKVPVRYGNDPGEAWVDQVSGNFFTGLGVTPWAGRVLDSDDESTHAPIAVVSYDFWRTRLGSSYSVIGQPIFVRGVPLTIVGIAGKGFNGVEHNFNNDVWIALQTNPNLKAWETPPVSSHNLYGSPDWWFLLEIGRLAPGISEQQAVVQLNPEFQRAALAGAAPDPKRQPLQLSLTPARGIEGLRDDYEQPLSVLMGMVALVLVIACGNIAMLLVARNAARQREFSLRMALGGTRVRLFRQLLTESLLLVFTGAALGWLFAVWATNALAAWTSLEMDIAPDWRVLLFMLGVALVVGLFFGLVPLRSVVNTPVASVLRSSSSNVSQDRGKIRSGQIVVVLQIAICLALLVGTGLLVRTLRNLENIPLGLKAEGLFVFGIDPQEVVHSDAEAIHFYTSLLERIRSLPGVQSATLVRNRIGGGVSSNTAVYVDGLSPLGDKSSPMRWNSGGPQFFETLGIPILMGRDFNDRDSADAPKVVAINKTFADTYLPHQNPIGHHIAFSKSPTAQQLQIVAVVANSKYSEIEEKDRPMAYAPYAQRVGIGQMNVDIRTAGSPESFLPAIREAMRSLAPELPMLDPKTQKAQFDSTIALQRVVARLAMFFGLLAVVLVATGLYGTLAYRVNRRTSEIGVRMAVGAQREQILWMILRESLVLCLVGIAIGLPLAYASMRLLRTMLYGLGPNDALSFAAALAGITLVALAASLIPARRAASVDPLTALRNE